MFYIKFNITINYKVNVPVTVNTAIVSLPSVNVVFVPGATAKLAGLPDVGTLNTTIPGPPFPPSKSPPPEGPLPAAPPPPPVLVGPAVPATRDPAAPPPPDPPAPPGPDSVPPPPPPEKNLPGEGPGVP